MKRRISFFLFLTILLVSSGMAYPAPPGVTAASTRQATPVGFPSFGINAHLATRYPDPSTMDVPGSMLTELGVSWVREDFHWYRIQPEEDVWDWHFNDAAVRELVRRNINIVAVLGGPSAPWATPYPGDSTSYASFYAPDTDAFVRFARAVVTRYRRYITHWEIWNEPDNDHFWKPAPDPAAYADLLKRTSAAIKEIDPQATVLIGGFNPFDPTFARTVLDDGAWNSFDILAIHPYVDPLSPEEGSIGSAADAVRVLSDQYGTKPIWVTEIGWASGPCDHDPDGQTDEQRQANFLVRSLLLLWESGIERVFWYTLKDDDGNPYGLIRMGDGRLDYRLRKPSFYAFRTLNQQLSGATFTGRRDLFTHTTLIPFDDVDNWRRGVQPYGVLQESGVGTARISYVFDTPENDYLVYERVKPMPLPESTYGIGVWVYGDGSGNEVKAWVRDAQEEVLQFKLGVVGAPGWQFLSAPIRNKVYPGNIISPAVNGYVDMPASFQALVLDDVRDDYQGSGVIYLDDLMVVTGREVYDLRFKKGSALLDVLWSPPGTRISFASAAVSGQLLTRDSGSRTLNPANGRFSLLVQQEPIYLWQRKP